MFYKLIKCKIFYDGMNENNWSYNMFCVIFLNVWNYYLKLLFVLSKYYWFLVV